MIAPPTSNSRHRKRKRTACRQNRKQHSCKAAKITKTNKALNQTHPTIQQNKTKQRKPAKCAIIRKAVFRRKNNRKTCVSRETRCLTEQIFYRIWQTKPMYRRTVLMAIQTEVGLASVFVDILEGGANSNKNSASQQSFAGCFRFNLRHRAEKQLL